MNIRRQANDYAESNATLFIAITDTDLDKVIRNHVDIVTYIKERRRRTELALFNGYLAGYEAAMTHAMASVAKPDKA